MAKNNAPVHRIDLRVAEVSALFNSMDPTPFHRRDLDKEAVAYVENWALEFSQSSRFLIVVHIEHLPSADPTSLVVAAFHYYFDYKSTLAKRKLRLLLQEGRTSLAIGLVFLTLCLLAADLLAGFASNTFLRMLQESLLIGGWVAMWRPMQILLYDWWPIVRRLRIYRNLGQAKVSVIQAVDRPHPAPGDGAGRDARGGTTMEPSRPNGV